MTAPARLFSKREAGMPKFRLKGVEVEAVQWNGPADNPAIAAMCDHYASLDHAHPYVTENSGARYLQRGCWVVDLGDCHGFRSVIGRYAVFGNLLFRQSFESAEGKSIPPQMAEPVVNLEPAEPPIRNFGVWLADDEAIAVHQSGEWQVVKESVLPVLIAAGGLLVGMTADEIRRRRDEEIRRRERDHERQSPVSPPTARPAPPPAQPTTGKVVTKRAWDGSGYSTATEQVIPAQPATAESVKSVAVYDRHGHRYTAVKWDGDTHTANVFLGDRYGIDWEYMKVGSSAILLAAEDETGYRPQVPVGHWIVKRADGRLESVCHDVAFRDDYVFAAPEPPADMPPAGDIGDWIEQQEAAPPAKPTSPEPVAYGIDGEWVSNEPPVLLPNGKLFDGVFLSNAQLAALTANAQPGKVIEYRLVADSQRPVFETAVNTLLAEGWELYGHVMPDRSFWVQPMVRREQPLPTTAPARS
jgi:hypothetical protein